MLTKNVILLQIYVLQYPYGILTHFSCKRIACSSNISKKWLFLTGEQLGKRDYNIESHIKLGYLKINIHIYASVYIFRSTISPALNGQNINYFIIFMHAWPFEFQQASRQSLASVGLGEPFFPKQKFAFKTSLNQREEVHRAFKFIL